MRTRKKTLKLLSIPIAVVLVTAMFALFTAKSAQAIIIVGSKTGMFTLTPRDAVRIYVANLTAEAGIIVIGGVFDSQGNLLSRFEQKVAPGQAGFSQYFPSAAAGTLQPVRVEMRFEGATRQDSVIPTVEVVDMETQRTLLFVDYIIDDGK